MKAQKALIIDDSPFPPPLLPTGDPNSSSSFSFYPVYMGRDPGASGAKKKEKETKYFGSSSPRYGIRQILVQNSFSPKKAFWKTVQICFLFTIYFAIERGEVLSIPNPPDRPRWHAKRKREYS